MSKFLGCTIFPYTFPWLTQNSFGFSFISQLQLFHPWYLPSSGPLLWTRARRRPGWKEVRKQFKYLMSKSEPWVSHSYFSVAVHCSWLAHNVGTVDHHIVLKPRLWKSKSTCRWSSRGWCLGASILFRPGLVVLVYLFLGSIWGRT